MKYLNCPEIGERPITEFIYGGCIDPEPADFEGSAGSGLIIKTAGPLNEWSGGTTNRHKNGLELIVKPKPILSYP